MDKYIYHIKENLINFLDNGKVLKVKESSQMTGAEI